MDTTFKQRNKVIHPVELQWHHPILTRHGFVPVTKEAVGFVRSYTYVHPNGRKIVCTTGMNSDYWTDPQATGEPSWGSSWSRLEPYLVSLGL